MQKVWGGMGVGFTSVAILVQVSAIREVLRAPRGDGGKCSVACLRGDGPKRCRSVRRVDEYQFLHINNDHMRAKRGTKGHRFHEGVQRKAARGGAEGQES